MSDTSNTPDISYLAELPHEAQDDVVIAFGLDQTSVRGRSIRLGKALDEAIIEGRYPEAVAKLLGEAMMIGAIVARSLKFDGRLIVQCYGTNEGAVSLLVADCSTQGHIRGYARYDEDMLKSVLADNRQAGAEALIGKGTFSMTIDQGPDMDNYQGLSEIKGQHLSDCAQDYFRQSEQVPTRIKLAIGQVWNAESDTGSKDESGPKWRGGGIMIQRVANDATRANSQEDWETAKALFATLTDEELIDPALSGDDILYRLFHEIGVRHNKTDTVIAKCKCSKDRLQQTLAAYEPVQIEDMFEDGVITAQCQFCAKTYVFTPQDLTS